jgi:hypothetical protein
MPPDDGVTPECYVQSPQGGVIGVPDQPTGTLISVPGLPGAPGAQGPPGANTGGVAWFYGTGAPTLVVGSKAGDQYLDLATGEVYTLS